MTHTPAALLRATATVLAVLTFASTAFVADPGRAVASEPPLGGEVTLDDGTVLPPMPEHAVAPGIHAEQLAEHEAAGGTAAALEHAAVATDDGGAVAADELQVAGGGVAGPGGPLPNGLRREVFGFLPYWELDATSRAALRYDLLSTIAYFSIGVNADGTLDRFQDDGLPTTGWGGWTSSAMTQVMNAAHARGVRVVPTITLMSTGGDYTRLSTLLNDPAARARLVAEVVGVVRDRRADGVNVDFEPVHSSLRNQFTTLVREIKAGLVNARVGSFLTVDTMAGAAAWATGYDVVGLTAPGAADALMVMAYDFHWSGSARAGGVAPIDSPHIYAWADALADHLERVPAGKLIWGVPYYGRAWNTTSDALNSTVRTPAQSVAFSYYWTNASGPQGGRVLAERHGRRWDAVGQVPWFAFWDANSNGPRQGYYEDPQSLRIKYDRINRHRLGGVGIWALGMDTGVPDLWNVLRDAFVKVYVRQSGPDRYATAAAVSAATYAPGVAAAYVATGTNFPDALAAGPLAARAGGPVLLTASGGIPQATANELSRLRPRSIVVLGGPAVVSDAVVDALRAYATDGVVTRVGGADRYETAAQASAGTFPSGVPVAYVATGRSFPDALAGGVAAGRQGGPMLLVSGDALPASTAAELDRLDPARIVVLGGTAAVDDAVLDALRPYAGSGGVSRLAGVDRYATAVAISQATTGADTDETAYIAVGTNFPDGLAGTPAAVAAGAPLLTLPGNRLPSAVAQELLRLNPSRIVILGGPGAISDGLVAAIRALWN